MGIMEKCILKIHPYTHKTMLEPFPDCFKFLHPKMYIVYILIEMFEVQDWAPLDLLDLGTVKYELTY